MIGWSCRPPTAPLRSQSRISVDRCPGCCKSHGSTGWGEAANDRGRAGDGFPFFLSWSTEGLPLQERGQSHFFTARRRRALEFGHFEQGRQAETLHAGGVECAIAVWFWVRLCAQEPKRRTPKACSVPKGTRFRLPRDSGPKPARRRRAVYQPGATPRETVGNEPFAPLQGNGPYIRPSLRRREIFLRSWRLR